MEFGFRETVTTAIIDGKNVYYNACSSSGSDAYRKDAFYTLNLDANGLSYPAQAAIRFKTAGFRVGEIPGDEPERIGGQRKMRIFGTGWEIILLILREYKRFKAKT